MLEKKNYSGEINAAPLPVIQQCTNSSTCKTSTQYQVSVQATNSENLWGIVVFAYISNDTCTDY